MCCDYGDASACMLPLLLLFVSCVPLLNCALQFIINVGEDWPSLSLHRKGILLSILLSFICNKDIKIETIINQLNQRNTERQEQQTYCLCCSPSFHPLSETRAQSALIG